MMTPKMTAAAALAILLISTGMATAGGLLGPTFDDGEMTSSEERGPGPLFPTFDGRDVDLTTVPATRDSGHGGGKPGGDTAAKDYSDDQGPAGGSGKNRRAPRCLMATYAGEIIIINESAVTLKKGTKLKIVITPSNTVYYYVLAEDIPPGKAL